MSLDTHFRSTAERTRAHLAGEAPHEFDTAMATRRRTPGAVAALGAAAIVIAVIAGAAIAAGFGGDEQSGVATEVETDGGTVPETVPDAVTTSSAPTTTTAMVPDPSLASEGLPVQVVPQVGLHDGQTVEVSGQEFPPHASIYLAQCSPLAGPERGIERCMINRIGTVTSDADGRFSTTFEVARILTIGGVDYDCASPPPEGERSACNLVASPRADEVVNGVVPLVFDPDTPVVARPALTVEPIEGIQDFQPVSVTVENAGDQLWWFNQCVTTEAGYQCVGDAVLGQMGRGVESVDGVASGTVIVRRWIGDVDCMAEGVNCALVADPSQEEEYATQRIHFVDGSLAPPVAMRLAEGRVQAGRPVKVHFDGLVAGETGGVWQCPTGAVDTSRCAPVGGTGMTTETGSVVEVYVQPELFTGEGDVVDCTTDGACTLMASSPNLEGASVPITVLPGEPVSPRHQGMTATTAMPRGGSEQPVR